MGPFKKYVTCIVAIFTPFNFATLCWEKRSYWMRGNKIFCIYGCFSVSSYINGGTSVNTIELLSTYVFVNNPHWKIVQFYYFSNIFQYFLYNYFRYTGRLFLRCPLFVIRCNIIIASWETKTERLSYRKKYIEEFVWVISLFWLHTLLSVLFVAFFVYSFPLPKWRSCRMTPIYTYIHIYIYIYMYIYIYI